MINIGLVSSNPEVYISHSLFYFYTETINLIGRLCVNDNDTSMTELFKIVNPYECIFSKVTGSKYSVSKIKPYSNVFYDFLEIINTLDLFEIYKSKNIMSIHFGKNHKSTIECMNMLREENSDINIGLDSENDFTEAELMLNNIDFLFFECDDDNSMVYLIKWLIIILKSQKKDGLCIVKMNNLFYKPMVDMVYLLSNLYEKIYIIKPNTSNITSCEKYIVCKHFTFDNEKINHFLQTLSSFNAISMLNISHLIDEEIPYYFINKLEEANIIVGQQQLEALDQVVSILKNKNREDRIDTIKKNNLQKCIHWCEKYKIPYNKFTDKINIFLSFVKTHEIDDTFTSEIDDTIISVISEPENTSIKD